MDKRTLAKSISKRDAAHQAHPVKQYLDKVANYNKVVTIKTVDGSVSMYVDNGSVAPYVPTSQQFAIWFDTDNTEEPIADNEYKFQLKSLLNYFN